MPRNNHAIQKFFGELGPGLITGAADDDPSGIATYSVSGAAFGYGPLWTALFCFPLMAAVQLMCSRLPNCLRTVADQLLVSLPRGRQNLVVQQFLHPI